MKNKTSILVGTRHFFYALLVVFIFCGCEQPKLQILDHTKNVTTNVTNNPDFQMKRRPSALLPITVGCIRRFFIWNLQNYSPPL